MKAYKLNEILILVEARNLRSEDGQPDCLTSCGIGSDGKSLWYLKGWVVVNFGRIPDILDNVLEQDIDQTLIDQIDFSKLVTRDFTDFKFNLEGPPIADIVTAIGGKQGREIIEVQNQCVFQFNGGLDNIPNMIEQSFKDSEEFTTNVDSWIELVEGID